MYRTVPRFAAQLRRTTSYRRLPATLRRWAVRGLPGAARRPRAHGPLAARRSDRWLRLLAGVIVMAVLFTVLLSAA